MANVEIRPVREEDIDVLVANMRGPDIDEVLSASAMGLRRTIEQTIAMSADPLTGLADGNLVCIFGVADSSLIGQVGAPWMLSTDRIEDYPLTFLRRSKPYMKDMMTRYRLLENWVDARNTVAIHWLKWLGFTMKDPEPYGFMGKPFHYFYWEQETCA